MVKRKFHVNQIHADIFGRKGRLRPDCDWKNDLVWTCSLIPNDAAKQQAYVSAAGKIALAWLPANPPQAPVQRGKCRCLSQIFFGMAGICTIISGVA
jgi:hypothetical protein